MRSFASRVVAVVLGLSLCITVAWADEDGARKYIQEATDKIKNGDMKEAGTALDLAETELEGVESAKADPLKQQIAALRKSMTSAADAEAKVELMREVERGLRNTKESIGNVRDFDGNYKGFLEMINAPENKRLLGEDYDKLVKQVEGFKKVHDKQAVAVYNENAERDVKSLENDWAEKRKEITDGSPAAQQHESRNMYYAIEKARKAIEPVAADSPERKAFEGRIAKVEGEFNAVVAAGEVGEYVRRMKDYWTTYKDHFEGWEAESDAPLSFKDFMSHSGGETEKLNIPKTAGLIEYTNRFWKQYNEDEAFKEMKSKPEVKAVLDDVQKNYDKARARAVKIATAVVQDMENTPISNDVVAGANRLGGGGSRGVLHQVIGDDAPELKGLVARCDAVVNKQKEATAAADAAFEKQYKDLTDAATRAWPGMKARFSVETAAFDPNNHAAWKGKLVTITTDNLMGYRFKQGDFPFATTLNGIPLACRMEPEVQKAYREVSEKVRHDVGDYDGDGKWEIIARVEGTTGQMMARKTLDVGNDRAEYAEAVTAPILTIVAAHCGPLAVATGAGVATESGKVETPSGSAGAGGSSPGTSSAAVASTGTFGIWVWQFLVLIVGLVAAAAALMKANFAPLASVPQAGQMQARFGAENLGIIGLICAAMGVVFLLRGYVYYGLFTNLAIIAAGLYAAIDWLAGRGIVNQDQVARVRPLGVPIGLACAALVIVGLLLRLIGLNLYVV